MEYSRKEILENRKNWIAALRSGTFKQGKNYLCKRSQYCCLGVVCQILKAERVMYSNNERIVTFIDKNGESSSGSLPYGIKQQIGLRTDTGYFTASKKIKDLLKDYKKVEYISNDRNQEETSLATLNDAGVPFNIIADIIEMKPKGLFSN